VRDYSPDAFRPPYSYDEYRPHVFTEAGQERLLGVIRKARACLALSGAVRSGILADAADTDGRIERYLLDTRYKQMACVDRLVEMNILRVATDAAVTPKWDDRVLIVGSAPL
jgi:hypothetical protein